MDKWPAKSWWITLKIRAVREDATQKNKRDSNYFTGQLNYADIQFPRIIIETNVSDSYFEESSIGSSSSLQLLKVRITEHPYSSSV